MVNQNTGVVAVKIKLRRTCVGFILCTINRGWATIVTRIHNDINDIRLIIRANILLAGAYVKRNDVKLTEYFSIL